MKGLNTAFCSCRLNLIDHRDLVLSVFIICITTTPAAKSAAGCAWKREWPIFAWGQAKFWIVPVQRREINHEDEKELLLALGSSTDLAPTLDSHRGLHHQTCLFRGKKNTIHDTLLFIAFWDGR